MYELKYNEDKSTSSNTNDDDSNQTHVGKEPVCQDIQSSTAVMTEEATLSEKNESSIIVMEKANLSLYSEVMIMPSMLIDHYPPSYEYALHEVSRYISRNKVPE